MLNDVVAAPLDCRMNVERLQKMAGVVRTGGKGTVRRQVGAAGSTSRREHFSSSSGERVAESCGASVAEQPLAATRSSRGCGSCISGAAGRPRTGTCLAASPGSCMRAAVALACRTKLAVHKTTSTDDKRLEFHLSPLT